MYELSPAHKSAGWSHAKAVTVSGVTVTNSRNRILLNVSPNAFPASRYVARKDLGDDSPIEYIQDPDQGPPNAQMPFILRLSNDDEPIFNFTFVLRQAKALQNAIPATNNTSASTVGLVDTALTGLTYIFASTAREVDNLLTREFHAEPNFHKHPNVQLVGDQTTGGSPSVQFSWTWRWRPPKNMEDRGGGWRNSCSFVEYNQRAHRLETLASFSFWVQNTQKSLNSPQSRSPKLEIAITPRLRVPSAQSIESRISVVSDSDGGDFRDCREPQSPTTEVTSEYGAGSVSTMTSNPLKVDVAYGRSGEDTTATEDGPLFRATMKQLEQKTGNMRTRMKHILRAAEAYQVSQVGSNEALANFLETLRDASTNNITAVKPAFTHYFEKTAKEILTYERQNAINLQKLIIEPINKLYNFDIKRAESKKKDFEEESKDYYSYVSRYLGQRSDTLKEKKRIESDSKYQAKRRTFELKRFDYSSFMHDLNGGRKDQEVLSQLTRYADAQAKGYLATAKRVEEMVPQLEALCLEVSQADKEYQLQRTEREEKRRALESSKPGPDTDGAPGLYLLPTSANNATRQTETEIGRSVSATIVPPGAAPSSPLTTAVMAVQPTSNFHSISNGLGSVTSPTSKFKGIRDLEEKDTSLPTTANGAQHRKEGLLWSMSRPGSHIDPKGLNKQAWHKFWIVLDQGKLSEYVNWKERLDLHMDPIDLRMASVREARNSERRFCFEVITPHFTRVYQAQSEDDMKFWITAINNALQSAFETKSVSSQAVSVDSSSPTNLSRRDIASVLTGKSSSFSGHRTVSSASASHSTKVVSRHATTGDRPAYRRQDSSEAKLSTLLNQIRAADEANRVCADCNSESRVEWVSINLGIVLCIECSGIHRSLGTHISKVRSLTLDTSVFTQDTVDILLSVGNRVSNMIWEAKLDPFLKPAPHSTREQRLHFISAKYADKAYVSPISSTLSHYSTADETLLASIKKNDIQNVLYALALRANPNALDRSRSTHAVFLALAAADPASPSSTSSFSHTYARSSSTTITVTMPSPQTPSQSSTPQRKTFPIAELLLQNGADIPPLPAPIPLSRTAQSYLEYKTDQKTGRHLGVGVKDAGGDAISALPSIGAGNGASPQDRAKERDARLQKRSSAGARVGKPYITADAIEGTKR
ncbi:hypothetical protein LTR50_001207 [Elasticomyces elasticus]|nr:hypothetical protein LTR50_001207 [Elasticomyces elasticus]